MTYLHLRVSFPNAGIHVIKVLSTETPRTVAFSGPPLKQQVLILHNGNCLNPYLSLDCQHVADGDLIVLDDVSSRLPSKSRVSPRRTTAVSGTDGVVSEIFRLADLVLIPYEISASGALAYHQVCLAQRKREDARQPPQLQTVVGPAPQSIPSECLPVTWKHSDSN
jgi:hypothetical protein